MINGKYSRANNASLNSVHTYIVVEDNVVIEQWFDVPSGAWSGNQPCDLIGKAINTEYLKYNEFKPR